MESPSTVTDLLSASYTALHEGQLAVAIRHAQTALALARESSDEALQAAAAVALAYAHMRLAHYTTAKGILTQALLMAPQESELRAEITLALGICAAETDDLAAAETFFQQTIDLARQLSIPRLMIRGLHCLAAGIHMPRGEFALAIAADEEAHHLTHLHRRPELLWSQLTNLSWTCWLTGQRDRTLHWLEELRTVALPGTLAEGYWHLLHGELAREIGDFAGARAFLATCRTIAETGSLPELDFLVRLGLARLSRATGDAPAALAWASDALAIAGRIGYHHMQGRALIERAHAALVLEDWARVAADCRAAMAVLAPLHANFDLARASLLLARALQTQSDPTAESTWVEAVARILNGGFAFWVAREHAWTHSLLATYAGAQGAAAQLEARLQAALDALPPPPLRVLTLGGFEVFRDGIPIPVSAWQRRTTRQLLVYLLLRRAPVPCEELCEALWPHLSSDSAALALNTTFSELRRILEPQLSRGTPSHYLDRQADTVSFCALDYLWCDIWAFEDAVRTGASAASAAISLYRGDFLPEEPYTDWALRPRERLRMLYINTLAARLEACVNAEAWQEGVDLAGHILEHEPWLEEVWRARMTCLARLGRRSEALHAYRECVEALHQHLEANPSPETRALYQTLKR
ncbi:MAG: BTAD domain-containing putative transcriptional regulator [Anaerolineae bacterium]|jgi:DNA-binding SARP family transcriptional activator|nr:BTAD domain-containing putative transcriptional regulator [Anaerolineae bacterium]